MTGARAAMSTSSAQSYRQHRWRATPTASPRSCSCNELGTRECACDYAFHVTQGPHHRRMPLIASGGLAICDARSPALMHFFVVIAAVCLIAVFWRAFFVLVLIGVAAPGRHHRYGCLRLV